MKDWQAEARRYYDTLKRITRAFINERHRMGINAPRWEEWSEADRACMIEAMRFALRTQPVRVTVEDTHKAWRTWALRQSSDVRLDGDVQAAFFAGRYSALHPEGSPR